MDMIRGAARSRTVWLNVTLAVLSGLELGGAHLTALFGTQVAAGILLIGSLGNLALRAATTLPLDER